MNVNYEKIDKTNPRMECKVLVVLHEMITYMFSNKKFPQVVTELLLCWKNLMFRLL